MVALDEVMALYFELPGSDILVFDFTEGFAMDIGGYFGNSNDGSAYPSGGYSFTVVPIPGAAWLFGSALLGLGIAKRRKT